MDPPLGRRVRRLRPSELDTTVAVTSPLGIEVPQQTFTFLTDNTYPPNLGVTALRYYALTDDGMLRSLVPNLEAMYSKVFKTAESYLNKEELQTVATQAAEVRKKAAIGVPPIQWR